jgi:phosphoadenosine phosphosulfate reductase
MSLRELTLMGEREKVAIAIKRLQAFEPPEGYYLAFSGGKDSIVIKQLAIEAGVKFDAHYTMTIDPPEVVRFIRQEHPDVAFLAPDKSMWALIKEHKMLPTRVARFCCDHLKERGGEGRFVMTGCRKAESAKRRQRTMVEVCHKAGVQGKRFIHPAIDWEDDDVWEFIRDRSLPYCVLYDQGDKRVGCVMCPMSNDERLRDMERWPKIAGQYKRMAEWLWENAPRIHERYESGAAYFEWWVTNAPNVNADQLDLGVYE